MSDERFEGFEISTAAGGSMWVPTREEALWWCEANAPGRSVVEKDGETWIYVADASGKRHPLYCFHPARSNHRRCSPGP